MRRVVITGVGIISPLGNSIQQFQQNLAQGVSGVGRLNAAFADKLDTQIVAQSNFDGHQHFSKQALALLDRVSQFALYSAEQAVLAAKLDFSSIEPTRAGCYMGTGMGGSQSIEDGYQRLLVEQASRVRPLIVLMAMNNAAASQVASHFKLAGPNFTFSTACSSSAVAIGEAAEQIARGRCDVMLAGGSEALLTYGTMKAWEALRTLAKEDTSNPAASCKPFSKDRSGLVLGEGSAMFVLESYDAAVARGAPILAELVGYATSNDFHHTTQPTVEGHATAMQFALEDAGISPQQIGYINAHGTGTLLNDAVETKAIKQVFGEYAYQLPVSSTKSMHGHLMGAAAAVELAACVTALQTRVLPPTMHLNHPDPDCDLNYLPNQSIEVPVLDYVMSNSFAFGGTSGVLIAKKV